MTFLVFHPLRPSRRHQSPQRVRAEQELESLHGLLSKFGDGRLAGTDGSSWELQFEPHLGLCCCRIVSRFSQTEPKRQGHAMPPGERSLTQLAKDSQRGLDSPQILEVEQVDHKCHVAHEPSTRLVEIHVDTHVLRSRVEMEEEVCAAGRLSVPPTLELMAGGLLQSGQLPSGGQNTFLHCLDERLESKNGTRGKIRHDWLTPFQRAA